MKKMSVADVPQVIILRDLDNGYVVATIEFIDQMNDGPAVPVYRHRDYYHSLESALKDIK